ncbi:DUF6215 domain-containing protein [Streptomyces sp. NPDC096934]|uniref:DUF6215 domain-containing protein n=1 Tax=Streptomyces sp. NPDC096934 TaxID=3155551 RepID=UPI003329E355
MAEGFTDDSRKAPNPGLQAVAAVVLVAAVVGGVWKLGGGFRQQSADGGPAACSRSADSLPAKYVSGARLCAALNRPDLPTLLGTPEDRAVAAWGSGTWVTLAGGQKIASPEATVTLKTYSVKVEASYDRLPVAEAARLLGGDAQRTTLSGHPAVLYSDRTFSLGLHGGKATTGPGGGTRCLLVARDATDGGGSFEVTVWRQDAGLPDDAALRRVAERVLPSIPGWTGA